MNLFASPWIKTKSDFAEEFYVRQKIPYTPFRISCATVGRRSQWQEQYRSSTDLLWEWQAFLWKDSDTECLWQLQGSEKTVEDAMLKCDEALTHLGYQLKTEKLAAFL